MKPLNVTIIQSDFHWENRDANLAMFEEKINSISDKMELVILPEMFSTGFSMKPEQFAEKMDGLTVNWMKRMAAANKIILTGSLIIEENENYYNRLIWMLPNGELGYYDKRHLFGYAGEDQHYTPGAKRLIASVKGWKINLQVCYDLRFPVWARQSNPLTAQNFSAETIPENDPDLTPEYDLLIYVANWPERRGHAWKTLLQARAIENQCYVIGVNRIGHDGNDIYHSGDSMIINAMGEVIHTSENKEDIFTTTLSLEDLSTIRQKLPFLKDADQFMIGE